GIFKGASSSKVNVVEVGQVSVLDDLNGDAKTEVDKLLKVTKTDDLAAAQEKVRKGDTDAAVAQQGDRVTVFYSAADQVKSAGVRTIMQSLVQATAGTPRFSLNSEQVEDKSLKTIQYY